MINFKYVNKYCCEDLRLIENYEQAVNGPEIWDCHHRKETDLGLSKIELIEQRLYFNRPAAELIFLTHSEHTKIHMQAENNPNYGKSPSEETRKKQSASMKGKTPWNKGIPPSEETRSKNRQSNLGKHKGEKNPMYGKNAEDYMSEEAIKEKRKKQSEKMKGKNNPMWGKSHSEETRKIQSDSMSGENNPWYGTHPTWMTNGITRVRPKTQEEIEHYRSLGYHLGMK